VANASTDVVTVEILGQRYPIRSSLDIAYVTDLAHYVDQKMSAAADRTAGGDAVRVAVLAALNIADEYFRCREDQPKAGTDAERLTVEIEQLIDDALLRASS
jgi:cell division protein ZapA